MANYKEIDIDKYYRKEMFLYFKNNAHCSVSITSKLDVGKLKEFSDKTNTKFYINFLYLLSKVLNSRDDYKLSYLYQEDKLIQFDKVNPCHFIFHKETETITCVYSEYDEDYDTFYKNTKVDIEKGKKNFTYNRDLINHPNYFDASFIPWLHYNSLEIELPDGYLYLMPIINFGKYEVENGHLMMPMSVRMNHSTADGFLISNIFLQLQKLIDNL